MSTLATAAGKFADKIVELLDVFDLSFFVSGAVAVGAGAMLFGLSPMDLGAVGVATGLLLVVLAYFAGLVCFAVGRWFRYKSLGPTFAGLSQRAQGLSAVPELADLYAHDELRAGSERELYDRLWVLVRTVPELAESFALVKRYWILTAAFDGLMVAILLWNVPIFAVLVDDQVLQAACCVGTLVLSGFCLRQASEYRGYQAGELIATVRQWTALFGEDRQLERVRQRADIALVDRTNPPRPAG
jgi:hypothetical protein